MELRAALDALPEAHVRALLLRGAGVPDDVVAEAVGVPVEAVPALLEVAAAKLRRVVATAVPAGPAA